MQNLQTFTTLADVYAFLPVVAMERLCVLSESVGRVRGALVWGLPHPSWGQHHPQLTGEQMVQCPLKSKHFMWTGKIRTQTQACLSPKLKGAAWRGSKQDNEKDTAEL